MGCVTTEQKVEKCKGIKTTIKQQKNKKTPGGGLLFKSLTIVISNYKSHLPPESHTQTETLYIASIFIKYQSFMTLSLNVPILISKVLRTS